MRLNSVNKELLLVNYDAVLNGLYLGCDKLLKFAESFRDSVGNPSGKVAKAVSTMIYW